MSGHSKWSQIKHKKAISDQKKGQVFSKLAREITVAAKGNPDPKTNYQLKSIIDKARSVNMPQENIERAIKRVSEKNAAQLSEVQLEAIGPAGVAIIIRAITDSPNRTLNDLRILLSKVGVRTAGEGSLSWMFKKTGVIRCTNDSNREAVELAAIEEGVLDIREEGASLVIYTTPEELEKTREHLASLTTLEAGIELVPSSQISLTSSEAEQLDHILELIDAHDDVQEIYTNAS